MMGPKEILAFYLFIYFFNSLSIWESRKPDLIIEFINFSFAKIASQEISRDKKYYFDVFNYYFLIIVVNFIQQKEEKLLKENLRFNHESIQQPMAKKKNVFKSENYH